MSFITIQNIKKQFGNDTVLDQISLSIKKGEFATLLGQSGCGKSTLMRCIAGLNKIDQGTISIDGIDVTNMSPKDRQVGMVFQSYALFPNMNVYDNIAFGLKMKKRPKIKEEVAKMIDLMGLEGKEKSYPHQLSGGQMQRVALSRSLIMQPKVLLLDEPLSALDAKIRKSLQKELKRVQREFDITTVFVTHDQEEAMTMSDTIHVMNKGDIIQSGSGTEIYREPDNIFIAGFIGNYNIFAMDDFNALTGSTNNEATEVAIRPEVIKLVTEKDPNAERDNWVFKGKVVDISMVGNILRYEVKTAEGKSITVEYLHFESLVMGSDQEVYVQIPKEDCLYYKDEILLNKCTPDKVVIK